MSRKSQFPWREFLKQVAVIAIPVALSISLRFMILMLSYVVYFIWKISVSNGTLILCLLKIASALRIKSSHLSRHSLLGQYSAGYKMKFLLCFKS